MPQPVPIRKPSSPAKAGDPVHRGLSASSLTLPGTGSPGQARARLRHRDRRTGIFKIRIQRLQRFEHRRAGDFDVDIELRGAVLQRLEFADRLAELLALLEVADRAAEYFFAEADHFGRHRATADIEHPFE